MNNIKIQYFIDYWRDLTHEGNSIGKELVHSILYNPKELAKEFAEEIERKNLSNSDNKKFFVDKINEFSRLDLECLNFIKPTLKLIQQQFNRKDDYSYLLHLLKMVNVELKDFALGKKAVEELTKCLTDNSKINHSKIKHLTNLIIFELVHKKYSYKTIITIVDNIFMTYQMLPDNILHTSFPHDIKCDNWEVDSDEFKVYQTKLQNYLDNLSLEDRVLSLSNYFTKEAEELRFVFQIKGIKGDNVNIQIGDVQIYNPKTIRLFNKPTEHFNELFTKEIKENIYYCNAAVKVKVIDGEYAKQEALQKLENSLDIISSRYIYYKTPFVINTSQHFIIDKDGNQRGAHFSNTWEYLTYRDALELDNSKFASSVYETEIARTSILDIDRKILESMHWKRKAIESHENSEKILWHWVALENIFDKKNQSTPKTIFEIVSKLLTKKYIYDFAWKHYHKLEELTSQTAQFHHYRREVHLPYHLKNQIGLNNEDGEPIYLKNFIDNITEIKTHLNDQTLFDEQLTFLQEIFLDAKKCLVLVDTFEKIFFEKLVYLYRIRNKIVHNAHNDNNPMFQYYIDFVTLVSSISIGEFIDRRARLSLITSEDIINNIMFEYDKFKLELKEKGTDILL